MRLVIVVAIISLIVGAGIYAGIANLAMQYAVRTSGSLASEYSCAPSSPIVPIGHPFTFLASIPEGTTYYWSAPSASVASFVISGPLTAQYNLTGTKTVSLFFAVKGIWQRLTCSVQVR